MNCEEAMELLSGSIDGENTPEEERRLQAHLAECPACRALLEAYRAVDAAMVLPDVEPPASLCDGVMAAVAREPRRRGHRRWFRYGAAAAAAALLLVVGLTYLPGLPAETTDPTARVATVETADAASNAVAAEPEDAPASDDAGIQVQTADAGDETDAAVNPSAAQFSTPEAQFPAADAAFPDAADRPALLVELLDDPEAPAAEATALAQLTAEPTAIATAVVYESDAATVRQIVTDCQDLYRLIVPDDLTEAAADDPCAILVVTPEE